MNETTSGDEIVRTAQGLAEELLFPAALGTDAADVLPAGHLDALAEAGFYGLPAPVPLGGLGADFPTVCTVIEVLAGACLTTAFVWSQHLGAVQAVAQNPALAQTWVSSLCQGQARASLALAGTLPATPRLRAIPRDGGWVFTGTAPWVSGWGRIDVIHTAARDPDDNVVWALVDATKNPALEAERLNLLAVNASATVRLRFTDCLVPAERVTAIVPPGQWSAPNPFAMRIHASLALGIAARCGQLAGSSPLDDELTSCRAGLDEALATPESMPAARAAASELAVRAAARLVVLQGSRAVLPDHHAQRLSREALLLLAFGLRAPVRSALLEHLERHPVLT
jgi:alkylation response protein AidB-like acyl-CoA dehydrogenase